MALFLIGFMASGKTTFGKALSKKKNLRFIDLDEYIEQSEGMSISDIFREYGEEGFRKIERKALLAVADMQSTVIACGGGTPCFFDNMEVMNDAGTTLFLKASIPVLVERLHMENAKRPLVAGKSREEIEKLLHHQLATRIPYYSKAHITWNSDRLDTAQEVENNVNDFISNNPFVFSKAFL